MTTATKMNDAVRHAAETTKHAAASTAHTLSSLAEEAQHRLEDIDLAELPIRAKKRHPRRTNRNKLVVVLALVAVIAAVVAKRRTADDRTTQEPEATDSGPTANSASAASPLTSVR